MLRSSTPKGKNSETTDDEEKEAEKKEQLEDDDKSTRQARQWDDWKDGQIFIRLQISSVLLQHNSF